jgi:hypothetical protein
MTTGYVYLIEREDGMVKIGVSVSPERRIKEISLLGGFEPKRQFVYGPLYGFQEIEGMLHKEFADSRVIGEWFSVNIEQPKQLLDSDAWLGRFYRKLPNKKRTVRSFRANGHNVYLHRDYYYVRLSGGKRRSLKTKNKDEALQKLDELVAAENDLYDEVTITQVPSIMLNDGQDMYQSKDSIKNYKYAAKTLSDEIGDKYLGLVTDIDIERYCAIKTNAGLAQTTLSLYLGRILTMFNFALQKGLINRIPSALLNHKELKTKCPEVA